MLRRVDLRQAWRVQAIRQPLRRAASRRRLDEQAEQSSDGEYEHVSVRGSADRTAHARSFDPDRNLSLANMHATSVLSLRVACVLALEAVCSNASGR